MTVLEFVKRHSNDIIRIIAAIVLSALMTAFILVFRSDKLPYSSDGDAFDTVYAIAQSSN